MGTANIPPSIECCPPLAGAGGHFAKDPVVGFLHPGAQWRRGGPAEPRRYEGVVAVAATHALGRAQVVFPLEPDAGDVLDDIDELVDRHQLAAAQVQRLAAVARPDLGGAN